MTSSNYNDDDQKVTGGRNGFGAKLVNIFSKEFTVETGDARKNKYYRQVFTDNMSRKTEPQITENRYGQDFTCISFKPDLKKFSMTHLDEDIVALMTKRVYDLAGVTNSKIKVTLNGKTIPVKTFSDYAKLYLKNEETRELPCIAEKKTDRWEVICSLSDGAFQ